MTSLVQDAYNNLPKASTCQYPTLLTKLDDAGASIFTVFLSEPGGTVEEVLEMVDAVEMYRDDDETVQQLHVLSIEAMIAQLPTKEEQNTQGWFLVLPEQVAKAARISGGDVGTFYQLLSAGTYEVVHPTGLNVVHVRPLVPISYPEGEDPHERQRLPIIELSL